MRSIRCVIVDRIDKIYHQSDTMSEYLILPSHHPSLSLFLSHLTRGTLCIGFRRLAATAERTMYGDKGRYDRRATTAGGVV